MITEKQIEEAKLVGGLADYYLEKHPAMFWDAINMASDYAKDKDIKFSMHQITAALECYLHFKKQELI